MQIRTLLVAIVLSLGLSLSFGQQGGFGGRVTGNLVSHGSINFATGGLSLSCTDAGCSTDTSSSISPSSQAISGMITFTASTDASGTIGGSSGGGTGQLQVSCDGGSTWNSVAIGSATLPTTSMSFSYPTPNCTGPTNANTLLFRSLLGGGGPPTFTMSLSPSSQVTISW